MTHERPATPAALAGRCTQAPTHGPRSWYPGPRGNPDPAPGTGDGDATGTGTDTGTATTTRPGAHDRLAVTGAAVLAAMIAALSATALGTVLVHRRRTAD